jgi:chromosome segregation ATPase
MIRRTSELPPRREVVARDTEALEQARVDAQRFELAAKEAEQRATDLAQQLERARGRAKELEAELETLRDELDDLRAAAKQADERVAELRHELVSRETRLQELDVTVVRLQEAAGKATDGAGRELAEVKRQLDRVTRELEQAERVRESRDTSRDRREQEAQRSRDQLDKSVRERDEAKSALEALRADQEREVGSLERALRERGQEVRRLQDALAHHEALAGELILQIEQSIAAGVPSNGGSVAGLRVQVEQLATGCAQREAELQTARWRVAELEGRLQELAPSSPPSPGQQTVEFEHALFAAQSELDALRQALLAEREARQRAESLLRNDTAADVQTQAVLVESIHEAREPETEAG